MQYVLRTLKPHDVVGICPECDTKVSWGSIADLAKQSTLVKEGWASKYFTCDNCQEPLFVQVVSKPFKSLVITKDE